MNENLEEEKVNDIDMHLSESPHIGRVFGSEHSFLGIA